MKLSVQRFVQPSLHAVSILRMLTGVVLAMALTGFADAPVPAPLQATDDTIRDFHMAIGAGDSRLVETLLKTYPELINAKLPDPDGNKQLLPVFTAIDHGQTMILSTLLQHGSPTVSDITRQTALDRASVFGTVNVVKTLLDAGANVDGLIDPADTAPLNKPEHGTPLRDAISCGHMESAQAMVVHGARIDLFSASGLGWSGWVDRQVKDHPEQVDLLDDWRYTPLCYAVAGGSSGTAEILLAHGADISHTYDDGGTLLQLATASGHHDLMAVLVAHGADVNTRNKVGDTALDFAIKYNQQDAAEFLRDHGGKRGSEINN